MFKRILIANRGEIACRILRTARRMGIATVAVYSDADAHARHVDLADEAYAIGPSPARQSYLRIDALLDAARRSGAEAIHPGYGFLSENADFAQACAEAGIVFIGPPPAAIRAMGSKSAAKALMERAGVPLVPGYHGADPSFEVLSEAAGRIGYPVLLKASAGGGGKGMRVVESEADLGEAMEQASGEAHASFGNGHLLVEKYLSRPRHIEVQVFADMHGSIVSLFERDCSIQRRHQKVLEEAPAPSITAEQRRVLGEAAIAAARAVDYVGAGTVEFIFEDDRFYFMEMNTRLQVEHPVSEFVTRQDLVEWQLRVAAGERLPATQEQLSIDGHAIEVRICAEDPERDFLPSTGLVTHLRQPTGTPFVRVDTGIRQGDRIPPDYDPMIAKLIVWGEDRATAVGRMAQALGEYELAGVRTNLGLLRRIVRHPAFVAGDFDTGFIGRHPDVLHPATGEQSGPIVWAAAVIAALEPDAEPSLGEPLGEPSGDPWSPWAERDGWRLNGDARHDVVLRHGETDMRVTAHPQMDGTWRLDLTDAPVVARLDAGAEPGDFVLELDGVRTRLRILRQGDAITVIRDGGNHAFTRIDPFSPVVAEIAGEAKLTAPTPSCVDRIFVEAGMAVRKGQKLLVLESMKMETTLTAPADGVVEAVHVRPEDFVQEGAQLLTFVRAEEPA